MKKKIIFGATFLTTAFVVAAVAATAHEGFVKFGKSADNAEWHHYSAVAATLDSKGIKEYWVSCESHAHQFTAPSSTNIVEMGTPSQKFIDSLDSDDDRLIVYDRGFNFDDGLNRYITIDHGFQNLAVVDGEGLNGTKALKASTSSNSGWLRIDKYYLDAVFSDSSVKSLSFMAKSSHSTSNFRHLQVDPAYTNNHDLIKSCYEANINTYGVYSNVWKQFYLTRGVYSQMSSSDWFIQFSVSGGSNEWLLLDDFRLSYTDYYDYSSFGFNYGYPHDATSGDSPTSGTFQLKNPATNNELFRANGGSLLPSNGSSMSLNNDFYNEGRVSLKVTKGGSGYAEFSLKNELFSALNGHGFFIDIYSTIAANGEGASNFCDGTSTKMGIIHPKEKWVTYHILPSQINASGRFLILNGSTAGDWYFDNFRLDNHITESFESSETYIYGNYVYANGYTIADAAAGDNIRDHVLNYIFLGEWGNFKSIELSPRRATEGAYSVKMTKTSGGPLRLAPVYYGFMDDDSTLSLDIYAENLNNLSATTPGGRTITLVNNSWNTVTLYKTDFNSNFRCFSNSFFGAGTIYIDNLVLTL